MPYQTGQFTSAANLLSTIENFATANGWTLSGGVLSNGSSHVKLTDASVSGTAELRIIGATSADFSTGQAPTFARITFGSANLPAIYYLFTQGSPAALYCVVNYNVNQYQHLAFGLFEKYGQYTGGSFFSASISSYKTSNVVFGANQASGSDSPSTGALFWAGYGSGYGSDSQGNSLVFSNLDQAGWVDNNIDSQREHAVFNTNASPLYIRQPNQWNSQATLIPIWVWQSRPNGFESLLGRSPHVRALRIDNYDPGDILTVGTDRWMVFPWIKKDSVNRNGGQGNFSGTFGWAIRYDGP